MKWSSEAETAIKKVPFFVRKRVRLKVEKEALDAGRAEVSLADVHAARERFMNQMDTEIRGFQADICFGTGGCPNRALDGEGLLREIEALLERANLRDFLKQTVKGKLKYHHELRVTVSECPNACSQPQIKDIGLIGAVRPRITETPCTGCHACVDACPDNAVRLGADAVQPAIDDSRCMLCGLCVNACPTGTIAKGDEGWRILLGGKLGRHPRLARELPGIYPEREALEIVQACVDLYKRKSVKGRRFAEILTPEDILLLTKDHLPID